MLVGQRTRPSNLVAALLTLRERATAAPWLGCGSGSVPAHAGRALRCAHTCPAGLRRTAPAEGHQLVCGGWVGMACATVLALALPTRSAVSGQAAVGDSVSSHAGFKP